MNKPRVLTLFLLVVIYCICFVYYLSNFEKPLIPYKYIAGGMYEIFGLFMLYALADEVWGYSCYLHEYVNHLLRFSVSWSFILMGLYHFKLVSDSTYEIYIFAVSVLIYTGILLYKSYKKGLFRKGAY